MKTVFKIGKKSYFCEGNPTMVHNFIRNSSYRNSRIMLHEVDNPGVQINVLCRDVNIPEPRPAPKRAPEPVLMVQKSKGFFITNFLKQLNFF